MIEFMITVVHFVFLSLIDKELFRMGNVVFIWKIKENNMWTVLLLCKLLKSRAEEKRVIIQ